MITIKLKGAVLHHLDGQAKNKSFSQIRSNDHDKLKFGLSSILIDGQAKQSIAGPFPNTQSILKINEK